MRGRQRPHKQPNNEWIIQTITIECRCGGWKINLSASLLYCYVTSNKKLNSSLNLKLPNFNPWKIFSSKFHFNRLNRLGKKTQNSPLNIHFDLGIRISKNSQKVIVYVNDVEAFAWNVNTYRNFVRNLSEKIYVFVNINVEIIKKKFSFFRHIA